MTWGNKLLISFIVFGALIGTLVYKCMQQNFELVSKDYYSDELHYQDKIDGMHNAGKTGSMKILKTDEVVFIQLPDELKGKTVTGEAWFYCANNAANDRKIALQFNNANTIKIERSVFAKANYIVKLSWQCGAEKYYCEQNIDL